MTQPAKVTEPSMEEILASIRRIIADDEAKPPPAEATKPEKAAAPASPPKPQGMNDIPPSKVAPAKPAAEKPAPPVAKPAPPPPPAPAADATNNQDDIDALLAGLDAATPAPEIRAPEPEPEPEPEPDVLELTDEMAGRSDTASAAAQLPQGRAARRSRIRRIAPAAAYAAAVLRAGGL
ncbi:cell pole-organizing protein PopZ [Bradyrhizobium liaoningense]